MTPIVQSGVISCTATCSNLSPSPLVRPSLLPFSTKISRATSSLRVLPINRGRNTVLHIVSSTNFHQKRLSAAETEETNAARALPDLKNTGALIVRLGERDDELEAASWLRARSFYAYPEERKFAGEVKDTNI